MSSNNALDSEFSDCPNYPLSYGLNQVNPADYTNFMYGRSTHHHVEDVDDEGDGRGDKYLGVIMKECECANVPHMNTRYTEIDYAWPQPNISLDTQGDQPCSAWRGDNTDYGVCDNLGCLLKEKWPEMYGSAHIWWMRDWSELFANIEETAQCCVTPSNQTYKPSGQSDTFPRTMKCPPSHWAGSPLCLPVMQEYCASEQWGITPSDTYCDTYMKDFSGASQSSKQATLLSGLEWWLNNPLENGTNPPQEGDPMVQKMANYCSQWPGLCDIYLQQACANVTSNDLKKSPQLSRLCACFLPDEQYMLSGIIPVECNGMCAINAHPEVNGVVRGQTNEETGVREPLTCTQTTCVIDDVTIDMINSSISGSVNFDQVCGGCPDGNCTCVMNNITVDEVNAMVQGGINLQQSCKGCSQFTNGSNGQPIGCDGGPPPSVQPPSPPPSVEDNIFSVIEEDIENQWYANKPFYIGLIAFLALLLIGIILFLIVRTKNH